MNFISAFVFVFILSAVIFIARLIICGNKDDEQTKLDKERRWDNLMFLQNNTKSIGAARLPDPGIKIEKEEEQDDFYTLNSNRFN